MTARFQTSSKDHGLDNIVERSVNKSKKLINSLTKKGLMLHEYDEQIEHGKKISSKIKNKYLKPLQMNLIYSYLEKSKINQLYHKYTINRQYYDHVPKQKIDKEMMEFIERKNQSLEIINKKLQFNADNLLQLKKINSCHQLNRAIYHQLVLLPSLSLHHKSTGRTIVNTHTERKYTNYQSTNSASSIQFDNTVGQLYHQLQEKLKTAAADQNDLVNANCKIKVEEHSARRKKQYYRQDIGKNRCSNSNEKLWQNQKGQIRYQYKYGN